MVFDKRCLLRLGVNIMIITEEDFHCIISLKLPFCFYNQIIAISFKYLKP